MLGEIEKSLKDKAVFSWPLFGNSGETESDLDLQVRRALKRGPVVSLIGMWYSTQAGRALLDAKAGVQMRNYGVDFLFFGNVWDFAGFGFPKSHYCGWTLKALEPLTNKEINSICKTVRESVGASWCIGVRLVSKNPSSLVLVLIGLEVPRRCGLQHLPIQGGGGGQRQSWRSKGDGCDWHR